MKMEQDDETINISLTSGQLTEPEPQPLLLVPRFSDNLTVLAATCAAFFLFCVAEALGAVLSHSLALLGDAAAMFVDVCAYFCNMYAEYLKSKGEKLSYRTKLIIEIIAPLLSIIALLAVTAWIFTDAIKTIKNPDNKQDVNIFFLWGFASVNFIVDIISVFMFYRKRQHVFIEHGHELHPHHQPRKLSHDAVTSASLSSLESQSPLHASPVKNGTNDSNHHHHHNHHNSSFSSSSYHTSNGDYHDSSNNNNNNNNNSATEPLTQYSTINSSSQNPKYPPLLKPTRVNVNMASAFTHVGADTLRTTAVFIAAAISTATNASSALCDAWAAIVVSITIVFAVIPLLREIYVTILRHLSGSECDHTHHHQHQPPLHQQEVVVHHHYNHTNGSNSNHHSNSHHHHHHHHHSLNTIIDFNGNNNSNSTSNSPTTSPLSSPLKLKQQQQKHESSTSAIPVVAVDY